MHVLGLFEPVIDLLSVLKDRVVFGLIDGTTGCESIRPSGPYYGPTEGKPVELNMIIAGKDIVAVDSVAAVTAGIKPKSMKLLKLAFERGLGEIENIDVRGERLMSKVIDVYSKRAEKIIEVNIDKSSVIPLVSDLSPRDVKNLFKIAVEKAIIEGKKVLGTEDLLKAYKMLYGTIEETSRYHY